MKAEFRRQRLAGAAVAVVRGDAVVHRLALGHKDVQGGGRVSAGTHFLVASTTKSMSSLLAATYVDDGVIGWDQPALDAWSGFRAPTPELTRGLRVRDLFGMATGIDAHPGLRTDRHDRHPEKSGLVLHLQSRRFDLRWLRGEAYLMAGGVLPGSPVTLRRDPDGTPVLVVAGIDTVRRTVGLD
jgi:CubicO group peptidase (beta-lactamase class C family)